MVDLETAEKWIKSKKTFTREQFAEEFGLECCPNKYPKRCPTSKFLMTNFYKYRLKLIYQTEKHIIINKIINNGNNIKIISKENSYICPKNLLKIYGTFFENDNISIIDKTNTSRFVYVIYYKNKQGKLHSLFSLIYSISIRYKFTDKKINIEFREYQKNKFREITYYELNNKRIVRKLKSYLKKKFGFSNKVLWKIIFNMKEFYNESH